MSKNPLKVFGGNGNLVVESGGELNERRDCR
jgi:hypothetical protein